MAAPKTFKFPCVVAVHDPEQDQAEIINPHTGVILRPKTIGVRHVPAGESVEVTQAEADRIYALAGSWEAFEERERIRAHGMGRTANGLAVKVMQSSTWDTAK